jgi:glycosyltransferase involved in cell wall biosynthesis
VQNNYTTTIIIPTKNEEGNLDSVLTGVKNYADEIIVVDGHSTDRTMEIAQKNGVKFFWDNGKGKGAALRLAINRASGDILVFIDADGSHDPHDIPLLVDPVNKNEFDLVVGSRTRGGSDELHGDFEKFMRMIGSDIITLTINYRWNVRLTDSQNGFRAIRRNVAQQLSLRENIFTIEQEMIMKCLKRGYRVCDVPTHEYKRIFGVSRIVLWKVWHKYLWCLIREVCTKK